MITAIINGNVVTPTGILEDFDVLIKEDRIFSISPSGGIHKSAQVLDAKGAFVLPGLIDIHSDFIENMVVPRPTTIMNSDLALRESERVLVTHGITTMFHSLSFISDVHAFNTEARNPKIIYELLHLIDESIHKPHMIHHRFHARFEVDSHERVGELKEYIRNGKIHLLSIMDHTPGQGQYRNMELYRSTMQSWKNLDKTSVDQLVEDVQNRAKVDFEEILELAKLAHENGIAVASHDDDTLEKLDLVSLFNSDISEFPITLEVAAEARKRGMHTVAGAPNILLGGSHSGNLCAAEAVKAGVVDILCSDYYPAGLIHSVFQLHFEWGLPLHEMVNLVSRNPAHAVHIGHDTGSIETGKIADIILVRNVPLSHSEKDFFPVVSDVFLSGVKVFSSEYKTNTHQR